MLIVDQILAYVVDLNKFGLLLSVLNTQISMSAHVSGALE